MCLDSWGLKGSVNGVHVSLGDGNACSDLGPSNKVLAKMELLPARVGREFGATAASWARSHLNSGAVGVSVQRLLQPETRFGRTPVFALLGARECGCSTDLDPPM